MNTTKSIPKTRNIFLGILILMIMLPFSLEAKKIRFLQSSLAPAASGFVKIKNDNNNNFVIKIRIKNMAEIETLVQTKQTYVVWMVTDNGVTENIGRINSSNNLNVSFETVTSFKPSQIFITAELDETVRYPDEKVILTTDRFWD